MGEKMDIEFGEINRLDMRRGFIDGTIDLTNVNPIDIASLLRVSVTKNDTVLVIAILDQVADILKYENGGGRILWSAFENENEIIARKLIMTGADLNYRSRNGASFLHNFMARYESLCTLMIEREVDPADVNITDSLGNTALYEAVRINCKHVVEAVSRLDIKYNDEDKILRIACDYLHLHPLLSLLIKSSDIATRKSRAKKVLPRYLEICVREKINLDLVKDLIDLALLPNHTDMDVVEILETLVISKDSIKLVKMLLDYVDVLNGNSEDVAQLLCSAVKHATSAISLLLLRKGANVNQHNRVGEYPLHCACHLRSMSNIHLLLSLGADPTIVDNRERTAFSYLNSDPIREQHKLIIRHFAIIKSKGNEIHVNDVVRISQNIRFRDYYHKCMNELENMKRKRICGETTFFCFFEKTFDELCALTRSINFLKNYYLSQKGGSVSFPNYSMTLHHLFRMAVEKKNILLARAKIYEEATYNAPPYLQIDNPRYDPSELENYERKYFLQLHERINMKERQYTMNSLY